VCVCVHSYPTVITNTVYTSHTTTIIITTDSESYKTNRGGRGGYKSKDLKHLILKSCLGLKKPDGCEWDTKRGVVGTEGGLYSALRGSVLCKGGRGGSRTNNCTSVEQGTVKQDASAHSDNGGVSLSANQNYR